MLSFSSTSIDLTCSVQVCPPPGRLKLLLWSSNFSLFLVLPQ
jgi:hypothetical protein